MNEARCNELHNIFKTGFEAGLENYPDMDHKLHYALIINGKEYPGYEDYRICIGTNNIKLTQNLQHKATTEMEKGKLKYLLRDVKMLDVIISYTENMTALGIFNVKIPRQSSNRDHGSKETMFE